MSIDTQQLRVLESHAIRAARRAGEMIRSQAQQEFKLLSKQAGSSIASQVLTEVDLESQRIILEALSESIERYALGLLTEESPDDFSRHSHNHFWCIDPMDGTLAFTKGSPGYSVAIALVAKNGTPKIGVVYDPANSTLYHAVHGQGAKKNGETWRIEPREQAPLSLMIDHSFIAVATDSEFQDRLDTLAASLGCKGVEVVDHAGAVLNACMVAERAPAMYFKFPKAQPGGGSLWDFAATACLFTELGLPVSDIYGQPLMLNPEGDTFMNHKGVIYASSAYLAESVKKLAW